MDQRFRAQLAVVKKQARDAPDVNKTICIFDDGETDIVPRALQCRNGIGLAVGGLRHNVIVEVL